jgi:hypothetical protein
LGSFRQHELHFVGRFVTVLFTFLCADLFVRFWFLLLQMAISELWRFPRVLFTLLSNTCLTLMLTVWCFAKKTKRWLNKNKWHYPAAVLLSLCPPQLSIMISSYSILYLYLCVPTC